MTDALIKEEGWVAKDGAIVVVGDPSSCPCCGAASCLGCVAGSLLSEGACPHAPGDTLTLVLPRPTEIRSINLHTCGQPGGCKGCGKVVTEGGEAVKIRYTLHQGARHWVFYPPPYCFDGDPSYPACHRAGPGDPCLYYQGCTEGGVGVPPFGLIQPACPGGAQPCASAPTLTIPPPNTWRFATMRFDLPCSTPQEDDCCDCTNGVLPSGCFACGMSLYQQRMAPQYPWAEEILRYRCGQKPFGPIHNDTGAVTAFTSDLWQQFLGFAHLEHHYLYDPACVQIPANVPVDEDGDTIPTLSSIVPKLFIYACGGVPMFEFDFYDAAAAGVISTQQADNAVAIMRRLNPLAFSLSPAEVDDWRAVMAALEADGRLRTIDWRGEAAAELAEAAGTIPQMAGCVVAAANLPELAPVRKTHYPALDPRKVWASAAPRQVPTCQGVVLAPADPNYFAWAEIQHTYFRCMPGGWTFAAWQFGSDINQPEDPAYVWYGREIGHNVLLHSQAAGGGNTDYAWAANGQPSKTTCTPAPCADPTPPNCTPVNICDPDIPCPALTPACDDAFGRIGYGGTCDIFLAAFGRYRVEPSELYGDLCTCGFQNVSYVVRAARNCVFDATSIPWQFRERTDADDVAVQPTAKYPGVLAACSTCQGLNAGVPPFDPTGGSGVLCPGHACWDATDICGGMLVVDQSEFTAPDVGLPQCGQGAA